MPSVTVAEAALGPRETRDRRRVIIKEPTSLAEAAFRRSWTRLNGQHRPNRVLKRAQKRGQVLLLPKPTKARYPAASMAGQSSSPNVHRPDVCERATQASTDLSRTPNNGQVGGLQQCPSWRCGDVTSTLSSLKSNQIRLLDCRSLSADTRHRLRLARRDKPGTRQKAGLLIVPSSALSSRPHPQPKSRWRVQNFREE